MYFQTFTNCSGNDLTWLEMIGTDWKCLERLIPWLYLAQICVEMTGRSWNGLEVALKFREIAGHR